MCVYCVLLCKAFEDSEVISQTISQPVVSTEQIDDDELRRELDDLLAAKTDRDITSTPVRLSADMFGQFCQLLMSVTCWS